MKYGAVYAKGKIVTVYRQPATKKEYEYDTVLQSEELGIATGQTFENSYGKFVEMVRIGVSDLLYVKAENASYNIEETMSNILPTATINGAKTTVKNNWPWFVGGAVALVLLIVIIAKS